MERRWPMVDTGVLNLIVLPIHVELFDPHLEGRLEPLWWPNKMLIDWTVQHCGPELNNAYQQWDIAYPTWSWMHESPGPYDHSPTGRHFFYFKQKDRAALFKLRWGGK